MTALIVERVQSQLDAQLQADDAMDLKALGILGANAAVIAALVATHSAVPYWWTAAIILGAGGVLLLWVVWPDDIDDGPEWAEWYELFGGGAPDEIARQMLVDLVSARRSNSKVQVTKGKRFKRGFLLTLIGLAACTIVALFR